MEKEVLLHFDMITKFYHMGEVVVEALKNASFDIYDGELLCIFGPSGSGKSTLLNIMGGMDRPTSGSMIFHQKDMSQATDKELTDYRRYKVGFVFQFYNLIPDLTAEENVSLAAELVDEPFPSERVLNDVGLLDRRSHFLPNCPGANNSGSPSPGPWSKNPFSCSAMSPPAHSITRPAR